MATRGIVLNGCYGGFSLTEKAKELLIQKGMSKKKVQEIDYNDVLSDRMNPLLVSLVKRKPEVFKCYSASLYVDEIPVDAINADAVLINEYDGAENVEINWEKVTLWKKSNEQSKKFATLEAAIISDAPKAEVMRLLEEFEKTIPEPMPSKQVPDELPCSDSENDE